MQILEYLDRLQEVFSLNEQSGASIRTNKTCITYFDSIFVVFLTRKKLLDCHRNQNQEVR